MNIYPKRMILCLLLAIALAVSAPRGTARAGAAFVQQSANLESSSITGLLPAMSAQVRGPASSYTLNIEHSEGKDVKDLMAAAEPPVRADQIECYDLTLTAINGRTITRNPQFGDATITIPIGTSMDPKKGVFGIYTINTDGSLQKIACDIIYGTATTYAARFVTIHFSTYAIVYTIGGATRVVGSRALATSGAGATTITNATPGTAATGVAGAGATGTGISEADNGKDSSGRGPTYTAPRTGDRRHYELLVTGILTVSLLLWLIARSKQRRKRRA